MTQSNLGATIFVLIATALIVWGSRPHDIDVPGPMDFGSIRVIRPGDKGWELRRSSLIYGMEIPPRPESISSDDLIATPCYSCGQTGKKVSWLFGETLCDACHGHTEVYYRGRGRP